MDEATEQVMQIAKTVPQPLFLKSRGTFVDGFATWQQFTGFQLHHTLQLVCNAMYSSGNSLLYQAQREPESSKSIFLKAMALGAGLALCVVVLTGASFSSTPSSELSISRPVTIKPQSQVAAMPLENTNSAVLKVRFIPLLWALWPLYSLES